MVSQVFCLEECTAGNGLGFAVMMNRCQCLWFCSVYGFAVKVVWRRFGSGLGEATRICIGNQIKPWGVAMDRGVVDRGIGYLLCRQTTSY